MHGRRTFEIDKAVIVSVCLHYHCSYLLIGNGLPKEVHRPLDFVGVDIRIVVVVKYLLKVNTNIINCVARLLSC